MKQRCSELFHELWADPVKFHKEGKAYALLREFLGGETVESLRPLLRSDLTAVQYSAMFIASELGRSAAPLLDDVIPILRTGDSYLKYHVLETIAACAVDDRASEWALIAQMMEGDDEGLRTLAMFLMSRADPSQLVAARHRLMGHGLNEAHINGLRVLEYDQYADPAVVKAMIVNDEPLTRRYGAIAASRLARAFPDLMKCVQSSDDEELRDFYAQIRSGD